MLLNGTRYMRILEAAQPLFDLFPMPHQVTQFLKLGPHYGFTPTDLYRIQDVSKFFRPKDTHQLVAHLLSCVPLRIDDVIRKHRIPKVPLRLEGGRVEFLEPVLSFEGQKIGIMRSEEGDWLVGEDGELKSNNTLEILSHIANVEGKRTPLLVEGGSTTRLLTPQTAELSNNSELWGSVFFHSIEYRKDLGLLVGSAGALERILDPHTGKAAHTQGYHNIYRKDGALYGNHSGKHEERIVISQPSSIELVQLAKTRRSRPFHRIDYDDFLKIWVGRSGAVSYPIDPKTGQPYRQGYHSIARYGDELFGTIGARTEKILFGQKPITNEVVLNIDAELVPTTYPPLPLPFL